MLRLSHALLASLVVGCAAHPAHLAQYAEPEPVTLPPEPFEPLDAVRKHVVYMVVPGPDGARCSAWDVQGDESTALNVYDAEDEREESFRIVQRVSGEGVWPVELTVRRSGKGLGFRLPAVRSGPLSHPKQLGSCEQDYALVTSDEWALTLASGKQDMRLYLDETACTAAAEAGAPFTNLGECQPVLDEFAEGVPVPDVGAGDPFMRAMQGSGHVYWRSERDGSCETYRFESRGPSRDEGEFVSYPVHPAMAGEPETVYRESYHFSGGPHAITLIGPTARSIRGLDSGYGALCGETLFVGARTPEFVMVGGHRWFFTRKACESAAPIARGTKLAGSSC